MEKLLGDIRSGFTKGKFSDTSDFQITKVQKVKLDETLPENEKSEIKSENGDEPPPSADFHRNTSLRGSGKKSSSLVHSRLKAIEEAGTHSDTDNGDKQGGGGSRKSAEIKDDLFDYLLQSGDDPDKHLFDRQGSLRRRRRNRNLDVQIDRERASSPITLDSKSSAPHSPVTASPLVTNTQSKTKTSEEETTDIKRWSSSSSDAPNSEKSDDHISDLRQRRYERQRRNRMEVSDLDKYSSKKVTDVLDKQRDTETVASDYQKPAKTNYPVPDVNIDINDKASRQYLIDRARLRFMPQNNAMDSQVDGKLNDSSSVLLKRDRAMSNIESSTIHKFLETQETNNNVKDMKYLHRNSEDLAKSPLLYHRQLSNDEGKTNVDDVIKQVERTGQEMESMLDNTSADPNETLDRESLRNKYQHFYTGKMDREGESVLQRLNARKGYGENEKQTITEKAWLQHVKDTERQRSNIDKTEVDEAFQSLKDDAQNRPYSVYDNMQDLTPNLTYSNSGGDVSSHSSSNASISTNDSTDTLTPLEPSYTITSRYARILQREQRNSEGDEGESPLKRSATLPRRWRTNNTAQSIQEESEQPSLRSHRIMQRTKISDRKTGHKPQGTTTAVGSFRRNLESRQLENNVQEFQSRTSEEDRSRRQNRFRALSQRYAPNTEEPVWPAGYQSSTDYSSSLLEEPPLMINTPGIHDLHTYDGMTSPSRYGRATEETKCDSDSVASSKDEGFESESVSETNISQRTSMSSTLEQELHKPEDETSGSKLFARSFDSLVKNDLVATDIDIGEGTGTVRVDNKTPTADVRTTVSGTAGNKKKGAVNKTSDLPPTPPERTTSKGKRSTTTTTPKSSSKNTPPKVSSGPSSRTSSVFDRLNTPKDKTPTTTRRSSAASSGSSTPKGVRRSTQSANAKEVTARLAGMNKPKRPNITRQLSNGSLASETSGTSGPTPSRTRPPAKPGIKALTKSPAGIRSPRIGSRNGSKNNSTEDLLDKSSSPGHFVRGAGVRATMPASVLRSNKKTAAENKALNSASSSLAPMPPKRTTSIRTPERSGKSMVSSPSPARRSGEGTNKDSVASRTRKSTTPIHSSTVTSNKTVNGPSSQNGHLSEVRTSPKSSPEKSKDKSNVFQRLMAKTPTKKTTATGTADRKGNISMKTTTKSSLC